MAEAKYKKERKKKLVAVKRVRDFPSLDFDVIS